VTASGNWRSSRGLIPSWAKNAKIAYGTIHARSDTVATKPAFRSAFKKRRCLVLADGYVEWQKDGKIKLPWLYEVEREHSSNPNDYKRLVQREGPPL
jgi:putative SOS response-associated peptidase YedK